MSHFGIQDPVLKEKFFKHLKSFFIREVNRKVDAAWFLIFGTKYSRMDQVKFFKGFLPQISPGPFLNTLSHLWPLDQKTDFEKSLSSDYAVFLMLNSYRTVKRVFIPRIYYCYYRYICM